MRRIYTAKVPTGNEAQISPLKSGVAGGIDEQIICHGPDLKGLGNVPGIGGLHPINIIRQLLDILQDARDATATLLMKPVVANLSKDDIVAIAAYVASKNP